MKLRAIKIDKKFIPKFNGNHDLPINEQVVIYFSRIPGTSEKANYKNFKFESTGAIQLSYNDNLMAATFVQKIENLEIGDKKIRFGQDLATASCPALEPLFTEIRDYLFPDNEDLSEGESKA